MRYRGGFSYLSLSGEDFQAIEKKLMVPEAIEAPVEAGDRVGVLRYELNGKVLGEVEVYADGTVKKAGYKEYFAKAVRAWLMQARPKEEGGETMEEEKGIQDNLAGAKPSPT